MNEKERLEDNLRGIEAAARDIYKLKIEMELLVLALKQLHKNTVEHAAIRDAMTAERTKKDAVLREFLTGAVITFAALVTVVAILGAIGSLSYRAESKDSATVEAGE